MDVRLTHAERALIQGTSAAAMAMRIVVKAAGLLGAERLITISSAHADGCLYHGDSGVHFIERLVELGGRVAVPTSCNVGALDLLHPELIRADARRQEMSRRLMQGHVALGCVPTWTCAPYQVGYRPGFGDQVAWGESNAVAFVNSVLGARTNRYGDFLDICCAITGRAPDCGLHLTGNRRAKTVVDIGGLSMRLRRSSAFYPVLGAWLGGAVGEEVAAIIGVPAEVGEDDLKGLAAGAAATGAVGLFHVVGVTPEAPTLEAACHGVRPERTMTVTAEMVRATRDGLATNGGDGIDCVAVGSPHYSYEQCMELLSFAEGRRFAVPFYVCTNRAVLGRLEQERKAEGLRRTGATLVVDTCVVVTPILAGREGRMMTNSAKFARYAPGNTGYDVIYGSTEDCVRSAVAGRVVREEALWA